MSNSIETLREGEHAMSENKSRAEFEAWARERDNEHAGKIAANGLDYPLGRMLAEAWDAAWLASRKAALEEAAQIAESSECGFADPWEYDRDIAAAIRDLSKGEATC